MPHSPMPCLAAAPCVSRTMRRFDPYQRLQTSSWADTGPTDLWNPGRAGLCAAARLHAARPDGALPPQRPGLAAVAAAPAHAAWRAGRLQPSSIRQPGRHGPAPASVSRWPVGSVHAGLCVHRPVLVVGSFWPPQINGIGCDPCTRPSKRWRPSVCRGAACLSLPGHPGLVPVADSLPGEGPPQAATAGHATASPPGGWHGLECCVRADATSMLVWLRRPGLIGGGDDIPPLTLSWQPGNGPSRHHLPRDWLQTDQTLRWLPTRCPAAPAHPPCSPSAAAPCSGCRLRGFTAQRGPPRWCWQCGSCGM